MKFLAVLVALAAVFASVVAQGYNNNGNSAYSGGPAPSPYGAQPAPAPSPYGAQQPAPSPYGGQPAPSPYGAQPAPSPYGAAARAWY